MAKFIDETDNVYNNLKVIRRAECNTKKNTVYWLCQCTRCGDLTSIRADHLRSGRIQSCSAKCSSGTHNMTNSPEFNSWDSMLQRCTNKNHKRYKDWGGRGITVCERWLKFENFLADMYPRPEGTSLDREDNSKGYSPENCMWSTRKAQTRNMRSNRLITINSETKTLVEWLEISGTHAGTFYKRLKRGYTEQAALFG